MNNRFVELSKTERNTVWLRVEYSLGSISQADFGTVLTNEMLKCYEEGTRKIEQAQVSACVVVIMSEEAGSSLNRALFLLWERITKEGKGELVCINYPALYIDGLAALGMLSLERFILLPDEAAALKRLNM